MLEFIIESMVDSWLIYLQDNMIDEEKAKKEAAAQMTFEQKINLLNDQVSAVLTN